MSTTPEALPRPSDDEQRSEPPGTVVDRSAGEPPATLELLADPYARELLVQLRRGPRCGRALAEACSFSRPTVYRRLNRLEDAGLVDSRTRLEADGNHCKEFSLVRDVLEVTIDTEAITVTVGSRPTQ